jgi:type IV pilus assembly protein PilQ
MIKITWSIKNQFLGRSSMANKSSLCQRGVFFLLIFFTSGALLLGACATPPSQQATSGGSEAPIIEALQVQPSPEKTVVEIQSSRPTHYTAFTLVDPPRVILDIRGEPGSNLRQTTEVNDENVREIRFEKGKTQTMTTRVVVALARAVDYDAVKQDNRIRLTLTPKGTPPGTAQLSGAQTVTGPQEMEKAGVSTPGEPRIFFKPRSIGLNQVLGVDFAMINGGRSLLVVTTDKKVPYNLERSGPNTLLLTLEESTIPPLLMRRLDSRYFEGTVDRVKAALTDSQVALAISLREMVPFHVKQTESAISIDFGPTTIAPPEKRLMPLKVSEAKAVQVVRAPEEGAPAEAPRVTPVQPPPTKADAFGPPPVRATMYPSVTRPSTKRYSGEPMYLDFVNAEVTNILRLINEVSEENIIWDPAIAGKKVSMVLKNVPWDQALELILVNNDLARRQVSANIIWITTKEKMAKIEAEERKREQEAAARIEAERQRKVAEQEKKKQLEPLITEFIPLDFATADEIKQHIALSDRGTISIDVRTNTIIIKDISEVLEEAKKTVKQFDTPVKQIMIEARIVEAGTSFTRDLGVRWGFGDVPGVNAQRRSNTGVAFGIPTDATTYTTGMDSLRGGTFSSNAPEGWSPNLGFSIGYLTSSTLGAITINAEIALAETEGKIKIISAPKVIASNGESAKIGRGSEFYLPPAENVEPKEVTAELSLEVTPTVSFNDFVTMEVAVKDENQTSATSKTTKNVTTKLMIKSGETIVIGGIYTEQAAEDEGGIPYLRSIPGLGWLFKAQIKTRQRAELLIFLTPTVVSTVKKAQASL